MLATLAFPSSILGPINSTPSFFNFSMFSLTMGCLYILSCIAGAIIIGMCGKAVVTTVVTGVSSIPQAIFDIVFAVAGQTSIRSALFSCSPASSTCSINPVISVITGLPVANSIA
ncbi:114aa long hypothetical protein [Pyrococcus horikoshii OT3]|uniref:Uncharacterized protein n=1 Tax=Pyrococcus horikoshii (strain ATCC 700860 / DSM 12428 / JCM 9974 / NBRC 100139 / OT-3) TaxID=70601 RepID=O59115_PYRHO|nr:114aa long hypothetical protein [Pyrococcus horikoshii OT3]